MSKPDINRLLEFQNLLLEFSKIERVIHRVHKENYIRENDTEHSYNLAMTAWFLAASFPELDAVKMIRYSLVHDLVEVHAGDTYVYADAATLASKESRETAAFAQLQKDWSDFPEMTQTIDEYEHKLTTEARFIYALDKIMPIMTIYINNGYSWQKDSITLEMLHAVKLKRVSLSPEVKPYYDQLYQLLVTRPDIIAPK